MKIRVLHHDPDEHVTQRGQVQRFHRNPDPRLHPFERAREYQRALVAAKMQKMFAKPLVSVMDGHTDSIACMAKGFTRMSDFYTGSSDGEVRFWNLTNKTCTRAIKAHDGFVRGLCSSFDDKYVFSCGQDHLIKQWAVEKNSVIQEYDEETATDAGNLVQLHEFTMAPLEKDVKPFNVFRGKSVLTSIDHHWSDPLIVTSSETVDVWDHHRSVPLHSFEWGCRGVYAARFNPAEQCLIASAGGDNSLGFYDVRSNSPLRKVMLKRRPNAICWNPMNPMFITTASEDSNLYTFDMRDLSKALRVHKDFSNAVLDVDYSPTGKEFVASSHDTTVRIYREYERRSREVYATKRMQMVLCCRFSADGKYVFSGSADMCVRVWKAQASKPLGPLDYRQRKALAYRDALVKKYEHVQEVRSISKRQKVPHFVKSKLKLRKVMEEAKQRRRKRQERSDPNAPARLAERSDAVLKELQ